MHKNSTWDEAYAKSLSYFQGDTFAAEVFLSKYALRDKTGNLLEATPEDMHHRLASEFARIEANYSNALSKKEIFELFDKFKYVIPQGSPMSAIGNQFKLQSLSNCFVIDGPFDSYGSILRADQEEAQIMKRRGGVGFDISKIRPSGMPTSNAAGTTDGIGVFMDRFSQTCREVAQGGRRGALMLTIDIRHPEITTFINIKKDLKRVTGANISIRLTDAFMKAVKADEPFTLQWPVEAEKPSISHVVSAKEIWAQIVDSAWTSAEPGILFWDTVRNWTPADAYTSLGYGSISTNPCLTGDTKIAVADGRGYVAIKELAETGLDVPVYACDPKSGKTIIRTMRNPRITGYKLPVYEVTVEGGHKFRATGNHKLPTVDGQIVEVKNLIKGDQLRIAKKVEKPLVEMGMKKRTNNSNHYISVGNDVKFYSEHRMIWEFHNGLIPKGSVIHHKDFNSKNNAIGNLQCMTWKDHQELHRNEMIGDKNPMRRAKTEWSTEKWQSYRDNMSKAVSGLDNGRAFDVSADEIIKHVENLTLELGHRVSLNDWIEYAKEHNLPRFLNEFRFSGFSSLNDMMIQTARRLDVLADYADIDTRLQRTIQKAQKQGYNVRVKPDHGIDVRKCCEFCSKDFWITYWNREAAFCSISCAVGHMNSDLAIKERRRKTINKVAAAKGEVNRKMQLDVYTKLRFELGRGPMQKEWVKTCQVTKTPFTIARTKYGFKSWDELKEAAKIHNHRVVSVKLVGE
jgi:ribonucleotide reductase alpha subunit